MAALALLHTRCCNGDFLGLDSGTVPPPYIYKPLIQLNASQTLWLLEAEEGGKINCQRVLFPRIASEKSKVKPFAFLKQLTPIFVHQREPTTGSSKSAHHAIRKTYSSLPQQPEQRSTTVAAQLITAAAEQHNKVPLLLLLLCCCSTHAYAAAS